MEASFFVRLEAKEEDGEVYRLCGASGTSPRPSPILMTRPLDFHPPFAPPSRMHKLHVLSVLGLFPCLCH